MGNRISVIIPTLNEASHIQTLLNDLNSQIYQAFEIIVVDGNSNDGTVDIVKKNKKVFLIKTSPQVALQRDRGARKAKGNLLVFLDADTRMSKNFLKKIESEFNSNDIEVACPLYFPIEHHIPSYIIYVIFNTIFIFVQKFMPCGAGSCIIVRKKTYNKLGGFEKSYIYDDMHFLSKVKGVVPFKTLPLKVHVSNRRMRHLGFYRALILYTKLSWYFIRNDYKGANTVAYPFDIYSQHKGVKFF